MMRTMRHCRRLCALRLGAFLIGCAGLKDQTLLGLQNSRIRPYPASRPLSGLGRVALVHTCNSSFVPEYIVSLYTLPFPGTFELLY